MSRSDAQAMMKSLINKTRYRKIPEHIALELSNSLLGLGVSTVDTDVQFLQADVESTRLVKLNQIKKRH